MTITQAILLGAILGWICAAASERFLARIDRLPVTDDLGVVEYRDAALIDWSTSVWAELDRETS